MRQATCRLLVLLGALWVLPIYGGDAGDNPFPEATLIRGIAVHDSVFIRALSNKDAKALPDVVSGVFHIESGRWEPRPTVEPFPIGVGLGSPSWDARVWRWQISPAKLVVTAGVKPDFPPHRSFVLQRLPLSSHPFAGILAAESWKYVRRYQPRSVGGIQSSFLERNKSKEEVVDLDQDYLGNVPGKRPLRPDDANASLDDFRAVHWPLNHSNTAEWDKQLLGHPRIVPDRSQVALVYFDFVPLNDTETALVVLRDGMVGVWAGQTRPAEDMGEIRAHRMTHWKLVHTSAAPFQAPFLVATNSFTTYLVAADSIARVAPRKGGDIQWKVEWRGNDGPVLGMIEDYSDAYNAYAVGSKFCLKLTDSEIRVVDQSSATPAGGPIHSGDARAARLAQAIREFRQFASDAQRQ